jgi:hypothetical protein
VRFFSGVIPVPARGSAGDAKSGCRFVRGKTGKTAQLDQFRLGRVLGGESVEREDRKTCSLRRHGAGDCSTSTINLNEHNTRCAAY